MKKLQNDFTTPEQSKRLLELGVPAWTADCYYYEEDGISKDCTPNVVPFGEVWTDESKETMFSSYVDVPCWSVGRLMEIYLICKTNNAMGLHFSENDDWDEEIIEGMCDLFSAAVRCGYINFSKLEE